MYMKPSWRGFVVLMDLNEDWFVKRLSEIRTERSTLEMYLY